MGAWARSIIAIVGWWIVFGIAVGYYHCDTVTVALLFLGGLMVGGLAVEAGH